jgi:hypothetical protein
MTTPVAEPDRGALSIPAADGRQYADDHSWNASDQAALTDALWDTVRRFRDSEEDVPDFDALSYQA